MRTDDSEYGTEVTDCWFCEGGWFVEGAGQKKKCCGLSGECVELFSSK